MRMYSIFDSCSQAWSFPFPRNSDALAIRHCAELLMNNMTVRAQPGDFSLYCVGEFTEEFKGGAENPLKPELPVFVTDFVTIFSKDSSVSQV